MLTLLITGAGVFFQIKSARHDLGGMLQATFHSKTLNNKDARTIVVCVDEMDILNQSIYITPTFDNPDQYSLRDFSLTYDVVSSDVDLIPSDFVTKYRSSGSQSYYQYNSNILQAHMDTKNPFTGIKLKKEVARCAIISKVTYDGAVSMFEYRSDIWFFYLPRKDNLSFDNWKLNCKQKIFEYVDEKEFDVYYITKGKLSEYNFDVLLGKVNSGINSLKIKEKENNFTTNNHIVNITIPQYPKESELAGENLKIDDYIIEGGDTCKINLFFNHPAENDCKLILEYRYKHKGSLFPLFNFRYTIINVVQGQTGIVLNEPDNPKRIGYIKLYHRVNPTDYINVKKNYNGYLELTQVEDGNAIILTNWGNGSNFVRKLYSEYSMHLEKDASIEAFYRISKSDKFIKTHPILCILLFCLILLIGPVIITIGDKIKDEKVSWIVTKAGIVSIFLPLIIVVLYLLFYLVKTLLILV